MSKPHESECHSTAREKMENITGSAKNFESQQDKAERFCTGGYAQGGPVGCEDMDKKD